MSESINIERNAVTREIDTLISKVKSCDSEQIDKRIHSIILTRLQEAKLFSLVLIPSNITTVGYIEE